MTVILWEDDCCLEKRILSSSSCQVGIESLGLYIVVILKKCTKVPPYFSGGAGLKTVSEYQELRPTEYMTPQVSMKGLPGGPSPYICSPRALGF